MHVLLLVSLLRSPALAGEETDAEQIDEEVVVEEQARQDSATSRSLDRAAIEALPARSADELLRAMPGLHQSAHGGRGKAYQYFLRGFDAVHGADIAASVEGVPVNELSNVHAHGYLDLQFLPTALVRRLDLWPGTGRAEAGDFAVAGSADFGLGLEQPGGVVSASAGTDRSAAAGLAWRPERSLPGSFLAADIDLGEGVGESRGWRQARLGLGHEGRLGGTRLRAWALGYRGTFDSPGVLREEDLASGAADFYDAYPGSGGGQSSRVLGALQAQGDLGQAVWQASVHGGWRHLSLQQNFTGWYEDEAHGDGTLQVHEALVGGASGRIGAQVREGLTVQGGVAARLDRFAQRQDGVLPDGSVWQPRQASLSAVQGDLGLWASAEVTPTPWLDIEPGLRGEVFGVLLEGDALAWAPVLAPKLSIHLFEEADLAGFLSYGRGFRSPDARGLSGGGRAPVALSDSFEVGLLASSHDRVSLQADAFATLVSEEIVFDHVAARYLATGSTRRLGGEGILAVRPLDALRLEAGVTWTDGRYTATGEPIPYAPRLLATTGAYVERLSLAGGELTAGARVWVLGPRPLPGGFASHAAAVVDLTAQVERERLVLSLDVDNALASRWRDGEFLFPSRWDPDPDAPRSELPDRHFTAGAPFAIRAGAGWRF